MHIALKTAGAVGLALAVAGCGSSGSTKKAAAPAASVAASASAPAPAAAPADEAAAKAAINTAWTGFFNSSAPAAAKPGYLQDAASLGAALQAAAKTGAASAAQSVAVKSVTFTDASDATVTYDLSVGGKVVLPGASGVAVLENGSWKVSKTTFCTLVSLSSPGTPIAGC